MNENVAGDDPVKHYYLSLVHQFQKLSCRKQHSARIQTEQVFAGLDSNRPIILITQQLKHLVGSLP